MKTYPNTDFPQMAHFSPKNEKIFQIVSTHSDRILYEYDILTGRTRPWNKEYAQKDILAHLYKDNYQQEGIEKNQGILQDSFQDVQKFFADIHSGVPSGEMKLHLRLENGQPKWYHFYYSSLFDGDKPITALITVKDISEHHEQELLYQRYLQLIKEDADKEILCIESDITSDRIEYTSGRMLELLPKEFRNMNCSYSQFGIKLKELGFQIPKENDIFQYLSHTNLQTAYENGERRLQMDCQIS